MSQHRPGDEGDRQDVQARRRAERDRGRRGGGLDRERRRRRHHQHHRQRLAGRSRLEQGHANREASRAATHGVLPTAGLPRLAVGAGAVWADQPRRQRLAHRSRDRQARGQDRRSSPRPGRSRPATEGVWFLGLDDASSVTRIDPRTNRVSADDPGRRPGMLWGVAVGARLGLGDRAGGRPSLADRARTETRSRGRSTSGSGVTFVELRRGAVWTGNYIDGDGVPDRPRHEHASRRGPRSALRRRSRPAPGRPGSAWREGRRRALSRASGCGEVASGGDTPDVLIASDLPLQGAEQRRSARRWRTRSASCSSGAASGRASTRSATTSCDVSTVADRRLRVPQVRGERERLRARRAAGGRDRHLLVASAPRSRSRS